MLPIPIVVHFGEGAIVVLSSVKGCGSAQDLGKLLDALKAEQKDLFERSIQEGRRAQLLCVVALDEHVEDIDGKPTRLLASEPIWVEGKAAAVQTKAD